LPVVAGMTVFGSKGVICYRLLRLPSRPARPQRLLILPFATAGAQQRPPIVERARQDYGLDSFGQIAAIRYTFNVQSQDAISLDHGLGAQNRPGHLEGKDKSGKSAKVTYLRSQIGSRSAEVKETIDPDFLNDNYAHLPFHIVWTRATVEDAGSSSCRWARFRREGRGKVSFDGGYRWVIPGTSVAPPPTVRIEEMLIARRTRQHVVMRLG